MKHDLFVKASQVFLEVCELEGEPQRIRIDELCRDDEELRRELLELLARDRTSGGALEKPAIEQVAIDLLQDERPDALPGFRLVRELGRGAMGVVWEAEQVSPRRRVALKLINGQLASSEALQRFQREVRLLSQLSHPSIARILETGVTPNGRPFFTMELVAGASLFESVGQLDRDARQRLCAEICDAVQHANAAGIIHRDLKGQNILIDGEGRPKILDFGIARATTGDEAGLTLQTATGQIIGTLTYMSPEQARADRDLDARSDVYALGVILYQLVTGRLPYEIRGLPVHEAIRVVCDVEPTPFRAIDRRLPNDLETIVRKALRKEREHRYASAGDLAADLTRLLSYEPISARPATTFYHMQRFVRRNRGVVVATVVAFGVLLVATAVSTRQYWIAEAARDEEATARLAAEDRSAALRELNEFFERLLVSPMQGGATVRVADVLEARTPEIEAAFPGRPSQRAWLFAAVGNGYMGLGLFDRALESLERAHALRSADPAADAGELIEGHLQLAHVHVMRRELEEAERSLGEAVALLALGPGDEAEGMRPVFEARCANTRMHIGMRQGTFESAERDALRAIELAQRHERLAHRLDDFLLDYANLLRRAQRFEEAEAQARIAVAGLRKLRGEENALTYIGEGDLARILAQRGKLDESAELQRHALEGMRGLFGETHAYVVLSMCSLATHERRRGNIDKARVLLLDAVRIGRRLTEDPGGSLAGALLGLGSLHTDQGDLAIAEELLLESLALAEAPDSTAGARTAGIAHSYLGRLRLKQGDLDGARHEYLLALEIQREAQGRGGIVELQGLGMVALRSGDSEQAIGWFRDAFEVALAGRDRADVDACASLGPLISQLIRRGAREEALELSEEHWEACAAAYPEGTGMPAQFEAQYGWLLHLDGRTEEGLEFLARGTSALIDALGPQHGVVQRFQQRLDSLE